MNRTRIQTTIAAAKAIILIGFFTLTAFAQQTAPAPSAPAPASKPATSASETSALTSAPQASSGKVVLRVGGKEVTQAELDSLLSRLNAQVQQTVARQGKRNFGEQYAMMLILSDQALSQHLDSTPEFQRQLALQRMQMLAQAEYEVLSRQAAVTPEDTSKYFSEHPTEFEEAKVRQVVIRKKAEGATAEAPGLPIAEARTRAEAIRKALASGTDANQVIKDFSVPNIVVIDAEPRTVRRGQLLADLDKAVFQMKEGEISELLETPQVFVMAQLVSRRELEQKDVSQEIANKLRQQKIDSALADLRQKNPIWMDDQYFAAPPAPASTPQPPPSSAQPPPK
ncbi:MAG: peptidyl-prolyl cis-trans isomerase [Terriglobia bacterium]